VPTGDDKATKMHVIKPQALGLSMRPLEFRKRFGLAISAYLHLPFAQDERSTLWSEQSMWNFLARELSVPLIDEGVPKCVSEFLVHGSAYAEPGRAHDTSARVRLGTREKTLLVFGDRRWLGDRPSPPQPFDSIPLGWDRAYGGPGFAANPLGRGHAEVDGVHWLPNIESPTDRVKRRSKPVTPASFGMLDVMHPQRAALRGTYDTAWLEQHAPGFPPDIDWRSFNVAPRDQWLDAPLAGDEPYELDHLHPTRSHIAGRLPGLCVRAFCDYPLADDADGPAKLREVPMRLTTVWFFPHAERIVLIFHGLAKSARDDASDIVRLVGAVERLGEARPDGHYLDALEKRVNGRLAAVHALNDAPLLPDGVDLSDPEVEQMQAAMRPPGFRADAEYRRAEIDVEMARDRVRAQGKDPDALGLKLAPRANPPTTAELPAYLERVHAEIEQQKWAVVEEAVTHAEKAAEWARRSKVDPTSLVHRGPPTFRASVQLATLEKSFAQTGAAFDKAVVAPKLAQHQLILELDYLGNAHRQPPAAPLHGSAATTCRNEVRWLLDRRVKTWIGIDLTGADLSGLDLSGIDLSGAWLEGVVLRDAKLRGTNFSAAVLAHADLRGADATGANFAGANLGRARLTEAVLDEVDLSAAVLAHCDLAGTRLCGSRLANTDLREATWGVADWRGVQATGLLFHRCDMQGLNLARARLHSCTFLECDASGVDFSVTTISGCSFVGCKLRRARFVDADMPATTFAGATALDEADFTGANLAGANLGECDAGGAILERAKLDGANLGMASLVGCRLDGASAVGALLRKAVLTRATLVGANLMDAIVQNADLRSANLSGSNLFGADLARVRMDCQTRLIGAKVERARRWPRLPLEPVAAP
jgi:uncharacterized protein YjbI with pentapeptide repeats